MAAAQDAWRFGMAIAGQPVLPECVDHVRAAILHQRTFLSPCKLTLSHTTDIWPDHYRSSAMHPSRLLVAVLLLSLFALALPAPAATFIVRLSNNVFTPNDLSINVGDTVRFINDAGFHDVRADDGSYGNTPASAGWQFDHLYADAGEFRVYCTVHSTPGADINSNMNARITVLAGVGFAINQGLNGTWVNPDNLGQGFLFDFSTANNFMFGAWFTFDTAASAPQKLGAPTQRWLTMQGNYQGDSVALGVFETSGGVFNQPSTTATRQIGSAVLRFSSCTEGSLEFALTEPVLSGSIPIQKALPAFGSECTAPVAGAAAH
jgi:plastocyanin